MRAAFCVLLAAACVLADESRGSKRPYIADAVGNTLPPPSNGPATVGSPVNLLTPDRYEFYTFDESGELVKRLMTLQEIQAIVAAGEESEGLVTFANDNQPTIAFNFSQPPYTKVHSVVTNVQNVLKAQMEAHKNNPQTNPTLDTPDVSDSWSLILPSIFGNTGVDIVPDKTSGTFSTPETETFEFDRINFDENLSKEGSNPIISSTTVQKESEKASVTVKMPSTTELIREVTTTAKPTTSSTTTTTTPKPTTTTTTPKPTTTTTTTTQKPTTTSTSTTTTPTTTTTTTETPTTTTTTSKPTTTTTSKPRTTPTTRRSPTSTTSKPRTTSSSTRLTTTAKPIVKVTSKPATTRPISTTRRQVSSTTPKTTEKQTIKPQVQLTTAGSSTTEKSSPVYEKISSISPVSTVAYVTERSTRKPVQTTKFIASSESTTKKTFVSTSKLPSTVAEKTQPTITTYKPVSSTPLPLSSTSNNVDIDRENTTTITTQSVSPSTTASSTEFMSAVSQSSTSEAETKPDLELNEPNIVFDVAQSISQIASDLGSTNYQPMPTTSDLLEATNAMNMDIESKDSMEFDIPSDLKTESVNKTTPVKNDETENFIKISTINPHPLNEINKTSTDTDTSDKVNEPTLETTVLPEIVAIPSTGTPMDAILSESMDDLLSQVVNQAPQSIVGNENNVKDSNEIPTTEKTEQTSTTIAVNSEASSKDSTNNSSTKKEQLPQNEITTSDIVTKDKDIDLPQKSNQEKPENEKPENNNFVKISIPAQNDVSIPESNDIPIRPIKLENRTETSQKSSEKQNNDIAVTNAPKEPPKESNLSTEAPHQQILHKVQVEQINRLSENVSNDSENKEITSLPKVDEFKKKIQKVNIDYKEIANERNNSWKLISTVSPPKVNEIPKDNNKNDNHNQENPDKDIVLDFSKENQGLEVTTKDLGEDIAQFTELCNELAFRYWNAVVENIPNKRSFVLSPFSITSMLAMMFMGARGATSGEMNDILKLDDMVTFNPHFTLKNISDSIDTTPSSGVAVSAFIRELYSDRTKGKILTFYKERAQHFYNGHVEEINFKLISDIIRRRTNLLVKRYTWGRIIEYMKANTITMQPPLAAFSTNIFQTDCTGSSVEGRDGEMYFVVSPNVRQRRLVPVPAVLYKKGFLAGYDPVLDATAAALGSTNSIISTLFLMPGQQGNVVHAEDLEALEKRLLESNPSTPAWNRLLRTLLPRIGLELQIPRFSHKSIFNISSTLKKMGLKDLFDANHADLGGLNGPSKDLYLSDMIQSTTFVTCGEGVIGEQHHIEEYPESIELTRRRRTSRWTTGWDEPRDYQRAFHDPHDVGDAMNLPLHLRPRQARLPARNAQPARLKFDRPFLYFVRHNPSGMILYVGRYNPRLLP